MRPNTHEDKIQTNLNPHNERKYETKVRQIFKIAFKILHNSRKRVGGKAPCQALPKITYKTVAKTWIYPLKMKFLVLSADAKVNLFTSLRGGGDCTQAISSLEERNEPNKPINTVENAITLGKVD